jgi:hypothetical protein
MPLFACGSVVSLCRHDSNRQSAIAHSLEQTGPCAVLLGSSGGTEGEGAGVWFGGGGGQSKTPVAIPDGVTPEIHSTSDEFPKRECGAAPNSTTTSHLFVSSHAPHPSPAQYESAEKVACGGILAFGKRVRSHSSAMPVTAPVADW